MLIFPFGGNGVEAVDCLDPDHYRLIGFIDDDTSRKKGNNLGFEVFGREILTRYPGARVLAVPGNVMNFSLRKDLIGGLNINEERFITVIHPSASVSRLARIGRNCLIMAGVVVTSNALIGDHVCILPNTVIHHDTSIGNYSILGSNVTVAGYVTIGESCYIGSGSSIISYCSIGMGSLAGMGSNILSSFPERSKIAGNPSRIIPWKE